MTSGLIYRVPPEEARKALALAFVSLKARQEQGAGLPWAEVARPEQLLPEGDWRTWLLLAGRGWGKTRTGAEAVARWVREGLVKRTALAAQTAADGRDISIPALLKTLGPGATYEPSKRRITYRDWTGITFSAEDPDSFRGYEHDSAWSEEVAAWRFPDAWDQLQYGVRIDPARQIVTTTPKPVRVLRELMADPSTLVTRGRTMDNAENLSEAALSHLLARYGGTRLGRQELEAEILEDMPGALWQRSQLDADRTSIMPQLARIVVAIDPEATSGEDSAETGIVVAAKGIDGAGYVLEDSSLRGTPQQWGMAAVSSYAKHKADRIIGEANNGGEMVEHVIRSIDAGVSYRAVHASRGKATRAEPISALYEQHQVHHVGFFPELEDQLCTWVPGDKSPDRLDALVWAFTELEIGKRRVSSFGIAA